MGIADEVRDLGKTSKLLELWSPSRFHDTIAIDFVSFKRLAFDRLLLDTATGAGATFARRVVADVQQMSDGVSVTFENGGTMKAKVAIVATGAAMALPVSHYRRQVTLPYAASLRFYITSNFRLDTPIISYDREIIPGYGWVFPLPNNEYNIGCYTILGKPGKKADLHQMLETFMRTFPTARSIRIEATSETKPRGSVLRCSLRGVAPKGKGNILFVGETLGTTFSFTGEGIGKAMETGEIAAEVVSRALRSGDDAELDAYASAIHGLRPKYIGYSVAERWLSNPFVCDFVQRGLKKMCDSRDFLSSW